MYSKNTLATFSTYTPLCSTQDTFPEIQEIQIPKPRMPDMDPKNYQPISLLQIPKEITGRMINLELMWNLGIKKTLQPQSVWLPGDRSTTSVISIAVKEQQSPESLEINCKISLQMYTP